MSQRAKIKPSLHKLWIKNIINKRGAEMSKLKEKDYQYVYDAISESSAIQNLIKKL